MRKILSLVLVLALVLGAFPAFADNGMSEQEVANMLKGYGVLIGNETGDLMLGEYLKREQALVILARLMGVEDEAKNTAVPSTFTDVDHPYYEPFIAYAEVKGWTNGIGNGLFGYGQNLTVQQATAYMLRALGYDVAYEDVMQTAETLGLLEGVMSDAAAMILRGQTAVMMYNTLMTKPNNSNMTLMEQLGLEMPSTGVAAIQKVEANNLKQLKVYFTAPVDEAGDESNWSVNSSASFKITEDADFKLSDDKKMVTITLDKENVADQQEVVDLTCKGLLEEEVTIEDVQFLDVTIPEVVSAEVIGINTIKVTFTEPMAYATGGEMGNATADGDVKKTSSYKVKKADGTRLYVNEVKRSEFGESVLVELYSDLADGEIVLEVKDVQDFQGYSVKVPAIYNLTVVKDTEKPYVVGFEKASPYEITLIWNEDIKFVDNPTTNSDGYVTDSDVLEKLYHTNSDNTPSKVKIDGNKMTLEFVKDSNIDHLLPQGTAYVYAKNKVVEDYWNNKNETLMYVAEVELDKEAPSIVKATQDGEYKLKVEFSENIYDKDDYEIKLLEDGKTSDVGFDYQFKATATNNNPDYGKVLIFTFDESMSGDYTIVFDKVEDRAGNRMPKTNYDFTFEDKSRPNAANFKATAYDVTNDIQKIVIDFKEKMDEASIKDPHNYYLVNSSSGSFVADLEEDGIEFEVRDSGKKLLITIPKSESNVDLTSSATATNIDQQLRIGQLKDAAGNRMLTFTATLDIVNGANNPIGSSAKLTGEKEVVVTIKDDVRSKLEISRIKVGTTSGSAFNAFDVASSNVKLDDGDTVITFKLRDKVGTISTNMGYTIDNHDSKIVNQFGRAVASVGYNSAGNFVSTTVGSVDDKAAPVVDKIFVYAPTGTTQSSIIVKFTEAVDPASVATIGNNGFSDTQDLIVDDAAVVTVNGVYLYIAESKANKNFKLTDDIEYDGVNNLQDIHGNKVKKFKETDKLESATNMTP